MDYQSNSKKHKETEALPEKIIEKVVDAEAIRRKKPIGRRFKDVFFGGEFSSAARYIAGDVLLPAFRNLIVDATTEGIRRMVYGESSYSPRNGAPYSGRTVYNRSPILDPRTDPRLPRQGPRPLANRQQDTEYVIGTRESAELVVERLLDILETYQVVSVADLNELVDLPTAHIDNKWGWTYLGNITIRQVREGYLLELPPTEPI